MPTYPIGPGPGHPAVGWGADGDHAAVSPDGAAAPAMFLGRNTSGRMTEHGTPESCDTFATRLAGTRRHCETAWLEISSSWAMADGPPHFEMIVLMSIGSGKRGLLSSDTSPLRDGCQPSLTVTRASVAYTIRAMEIHARIREARKAAGLTQEQLADQCGISRPAVVQWERPPSRGKRTTPATPHLQVLSRLSGYSLEWLLTGDGEKGCREDHPPYQDARRDAGALTREEQALVALYRQLPPGDRARLRAVIDALGFTDCGSIPDTGS